MKTPLFGLLFLSLLFISTRAIAQLPQCVDNVVGNYFDYDNPKDFLYQVETQSTCIMDMMIRADALDYMTAHTSRVDVYGDVIIDEAINLCEIYMYSDECAGVNDIENIFVNISIPDPDLPTLTDTNYETIYDLKKTDHPDHIVGTGVYYQLQLCTGAGTGGGGIGNPGGPGPSTNISIPWPFYFKFNVVTNSFIYFKRLKKPGVGNCGKIPIDAIPTDIERINSSQYVICLSEGTDRGLLRINGNTGAILGIKKYPYGQDQFFDPVDVEVYQNKIYAVGKIKLHPYNTYVPALLSTNRFLNGLKLKRYDNPGSNGNSDYLKMTGIKANPVSNSLMLTGWTFSGIGAILAIHVKNLSTLDLDWERVIRASIPNGIHNFGWTYGLENLQGSSSFALHAYGSEIYGLDAKNSHYLLTIGSDINDPLTVSGLHNGFHSTAKNPIPANNTLVQSPRTGNLGLVLHRDDQSNLFTPISLLNTNLSSNTIDCLGPLTPEELIIDSEAFDVAFSTSNNSSTLENVVPAQILILPASWNEKCDPPSNPGGGGGMGARLQQPENLFTTFSFAPNPTSSIIKLDIQGDYQIFDINGRMLLETKQVQLIDVSILNPGIYFIRNADKHIKKLIVN